MLALSQIKPYGSNLARKMLARRINAPAWFWDLLSKFSSGELIISEGDLPSLGPLD